MHTIKIRFNTGCKDNLMYWIVIFDGAEHLASDVEIDVPTHTTRDFVSAGVEEFHISCNAKKIVWQGTRVVISN